MRYTKIYPDGTVTLDGAQFNVAQEVIDGNIRNSEPIKAAVERLRELEDRSEPKKVIKTDTYRQACPTCGSYVNDIFCRGCGQAISWNINDEED